MIVWSIPHTKTVTCSDRRNRLTALSIVVIMLVIHNILDWRKIRGLEKRIEELEYKNKHKIFTGREPVSRIKLME